MSDQTSEYPIREHNDTGWLDAWGNDVEPPHDETMTVGQLRKTLANIGDDVLITVRF